MKKLPTIFIISLSMFMACSGQNGKYATEESQERQEAREDSLELVAAYGRQSKITKRVPVSFETDAIQAQSALDAADDPALWFNRQTPEKSIIIGSNKKGGIHLYNMQGKEIAYFPVGDINNVDVLYDFRLGGKMVDIVGGSNRSDQSIDLFVLDPGPLHLVDIAAGILPVDRTEIDDVYGFCLYKEKETGRAFVFINGKNGRVQQFVLSVTKDLKIMATKVRDIIFNSQVEGMVADTEYERLFVGEENVGIWSLSAHPDSGGYKTLVLQSTEQNPYISYDIEGLSIYEKGKEGYLLASSQGNFSYAVFERKAPHSFLGSFVISSKDSMDGAEETDGIEAISYFLGTSYPTGIFISQDGFNHDKGEIVPQNFKVVDWREIQTIIDQGM